MRLYNQICAALFSLSVVVQAQTNGPVSASSSLINTNRPVHPLSLQEAIKMAVENNFDIAIARFEPQIAQFRLSGTYAGYEPRFNVEARHEDEEAEGSPLFTGSAIIRPGTATRRDVLDSSLQGVTPWGLNYNLSGGGSHSISDSPSGQTESYNSFWDMTLSQPLLRNFWIDNNRLSIMLARKDLKISEYNLLFSIMQVINQVEQTYFDLIAARDNLRARQIALELAQRLVDENRQRVRVGTMAPLDEKQAESEAAARQADLIAAQFEIIRAENTLKDLISNNYDQWHALGIEPTENLIAVAQVFDRQDSWNKGLALRPDLNQLKTELERQGLQVKYDFNQLFPTLNLIGSYGHNGLDRSVFDANGVKVRDASFSGSLSDLREGTAPSYYYGAQLSVPLTMRSERNRWKADKAILEQQTLELKKRHQQILNNIDTAVSSAQSSYQRLQATRAAREFARDAVEAEQKKYENGKSRPFEVLRVQRDLIDARTSEIRALADYNKSLSELSFQEGSILDRNRVSVKFR